MRYGLQYATGDPFPQDVEVSVVLDDEPVEVVPEDCPECPPAGDCVPLCNHVHLIMAGVLRSVSIEVTICYSYPTILEGVAGDTVNFELNKILGPARGGQRSTLYIFPAMQKCGHRTRAVVNDGTSEWNVVTYIYDKNVFLVESHDGVALLWDGFPLTTGPHTGTVQFQIDLTDAAVGSETWTDFGPLIEITDTP